MPTTLREMALTLDLVARATRVVEDAGPSPGAIYMMKITTRPSKTVGLTLRPALDTRVPDLLVRKR